MWGILVLVGGIVGYVKRGSTASLARGAGFGTVLLIAGVLSLKAYEKRKTSSLGDHDDCASRKDGRLRLELIIKPDKLEHENENHRALPWLRKMMEEDRDR
ncbi:hypothetical protein MRB53_021493 [Persea americana]|uniref:Uncharacterized protein n=1 Tax=Persea americana TaxID=3435 RepID=A0ACC2L464_PERAE|nr:hypothetical protein MRB53_021493 [Persea americana]